MSGSTSSAPPPGPAPPPGAATSSAPPPGQWQPPPWATLPARPDVVLEVRRGEELLQRHELKGRKFFILGRQPVVSHILVEDDLISRQHAALVHCKDAVYVFDLKSAKGVTVGGKRIRPMEPRQLVDGEPIVLGELALQYVVKGLTAPPSRAVAAARVGGGAHRRSARLMRRARSRCRSSTCRASPPTCLGATGSRQTWWCRMTRSRASTPPFCTARPAPTAAALCTCWTSSPPQARLSTWAAAGSGCRPTRQRCCRSAAASGWASAPRCSSTVARAGRAGAEEGVEPEDDAPRFADAAEHGDKSAVISNGVQPQSVDLFDLAAVPAEGDGAADGAAPTATARRRRRCQTATSATCCCRSSANRWRRWGRRRRTRGARRSRRSAGEATTRVRTSARRLRPWRSTS